MNGDRIESTTNASAVLGGAFHHAIDVFFNSDGDALADGLKEGIRYLEEYVEGFIKWSKVIPDRQTILEKFAFIYNSRIKTLKKGEGFIGTELKMEQSVDVEWRGARVSLPVKLKGYVDRLERDEEGRLIILDEKTCYSFSDPEKIDGRKILQAIIYYFLVFAEYGEEPYKLRFVETKYTNAKDGEQTKSYDIVFSENELFFDFFLRFYEETVKALSGEQVFLPNIDALYDNEIGIIAYVHRLDMPDEKAKQQKLHKVESITEVLKKKVASVRNMKALSAAIERSLVEYKNIDYTKMKNEEKIATKLMEHGIVLHFDSVVDGNSFYQYRFSPSIGVKMSALYGYAADIEQALGMSGVRIIAPIPNTTFVGIEIPKKDRKFVRLTKAVIGSREEGLPLGINSNGEIVRLKLDDMPHMLVAGATGSGKSVFLNSTIEAIIEQEKNLSLYLVDPKRVELTKFVNDAEKVGYTPDQAVDILADLYKEMDKRYQIIQGKGERSYAACGMGQIVCVIDEFADLLLSSEGNTLQDLMIRIAQMGRAAGIHLIVATQRPDAKVITGLIKANFPTKVAFATSSEMNSRIILDEAGAEKLMGKGDGLVANPAFVGLQRIQGFSS